jgi:hypothetical protein
MQFIPQIIILKALIIKNNALFFFSHMAL